MAREIVNWRYDKYRTIEHQYVLIGKTFKFDRDIESSHRIVFKAYRTTNNTNRKNVRYSRMKSECIVNPRPINSRARITRLPLPVRR